MVPSASGELLLPSPPLLWRGLFCRILHFVEHRAVHNSVVQSFSCMALFISTSTDMKLMIKVAICMALTSSFLFIWRRRP